MTTLKFSIKDERGSALLLTIVVVGILTMLSAAFANLVTQEYRNAAWQRNWVQAYYIAEAGMAKAWFTLKSGVKGSTNNLGDFVKGPDGEPNTSDDGALSFGPSVNFGAGSFSVVIADNNDEEPNNNFSDSDDILMLNSTGVVGNATRMIQVTLTALPFIPNYAITTGGNFNISGNPTVQGSNGTVHANSNLTISGNPNISQNVLAGGNVNISGNPTIGGTTSSGVATISIPPVNPGFYRGNADYELRSDGGVFDVATQTLTYPGTFNGWAHSGDTWSINGGEADGTYYIEGDAKVSGNPGSEADPWRVTIIATGSIEISGNPNIRFETPDLLFVAGRDIDITGNPNQSYAGVILAHEQIKISGNPSIEGAMIAEDAENISGTVTENKISGNATITYNGNLLPPLPKIYTGQLGLLSWH